MKTALPILMCLTATAHAAPPVVCRSGCNVIQKRVAVVPLAIANQVQIVRTLPNAYYTTDQYANQYSAQSNGAGYAELLAELRGIRQAIEAQGGVVRTANADPLRLTHGLCNKCHSGPKAKGGFHTDGDLSADDRLKAVSRILADDENERMPKGRTLDAKQIGLLIQELSKRPIEAEADEPPPPPNPDDDPVRTYP